MNWKLERELTDEENELLNFVHFPREVRIQNRMQKRIKKTVSIGGYINNKAPKLSDITYHIVPKNVAQYQKSKQLTPETQKAKSCLHIYFENSEIESELNYLLSTYCTPRPTPSMTGVPGSGTSAMQCRSASIVTTPPSQSASPVHL